jgi:hypothetical protein
MPTLRTMTALTGALVAMACRDRGSAGPSANDLSALSPEIFSHTDAAYVDDEKCGGAEGIVISSGSIGPVRLGGRLKDLRARCEVGVVKVPGSIVVQAPVLEVSVGGGVILFTVAGKDSTVQTAGTTSPAFRTLGGVGVGSGARKLQAQRGQLCFRRDSTRVIEVLMSRRKIKC